MKILLYFKHEAWSFNNIIKSKEDIHAEYHKSNSSDFLLTFFMETI